MDPFSNTNNEAATRHAIHKTSRMGPGAEQDRYGQHFGIGEDGLKKMKAAAAGWKVSGAEQDRYQMHFGLDEDRVKAAARHLLNAKGEGAEQDRHAAHFGLGADGWARARRLAHAQGMGAEQDRYGAHWSLDRGINKGVDKVERAAQAAQEELKK